MEDIVKTIDQFNSYSYQGRRNLLLRNMKVNEKYLILSAQRYVKPKSGKCIIKLILDKYYIYLPKRFNTLSDGFLTQISANKNYMIHSCGIWRNTYNLVFSNNQLNEAQTTYDINDLLNFDYCPVHYTPNEN